MRALVNRLVALCVGGALGAVGVVAVVEAAANGIGSGFVWFPGRSWLTTLETVRWTNTTVVSVAVIVIVVGALLVLAQLAPKRKRTAPIDQPGGSWQVARRSTEAHLRRQLGREPATSGVRVKLRPRRLRWKVKVVARTGGAQEAALREAARREVAKLGAPDQIAVKVKAKKGELLT